MTDRVQQLIGGKWSGGNAGHSRNPVDGSVVASCPAADWALISEAIEHGVRAYESMAGLGPEPIARFLNLLADRIDQSAEKLVEAAHLETALPKSPRLKDIELPRTTDQLRQAAAATKSRSWHRPTISVADNVRSMLSPLPGPVVTMGPSNFPFAFNSVVGGDAAAAWATGHPVIAKAHPGQILTSYLLAQIAAAASKEAGLPDGAIQVIYLVEPSDGLRMVSDRRIAATAFTGSRPSGMALKAAADDGGVPIYLEMSSPNPIVVLDHAADERPQAIAQELVESLVLGVGQFCTKPGLLFLVDRESTQQVVDEIERLVAEHPGGVMTSGRLKGAFEKSVAQLVDSGAQIMASGVAPDGHAGVSAQLLRTTGTQFRASPEALQVEAFGPASLVVMCDDVPELLGCLARIEGSLAAAVYGSAKDHDTWVEVSRVLTPRVGRLVFNRTTTGVKVVPAMNHGGPFPSSGHPGFTAVGVPRSLERFAKLVSYDAVPDRYLPPELQNSNPLGLWREVDGEPTRAEVR